MTNKTRIYIAVVVLGLGALIVDRCFLGATAPQTIAADEIDAEESETSAAAPVPPRRPARAATATKISVPELHFPRNLPALDADGNIRDLFLRPGRPVESKPQNQGGPAESEKKTAPAIGREAFFAAHRVDGVFVQESLRIAVVDGRWMRIGDELDQCTLVAIKGDAATFQCHDGDTVLSPSRRKDMRGD